MIKAQGAYANVQGCAMRRLGLSLLPWGRQQDVQALAALQRVGMLWPQQTLADGQNSAVLRLRLGASAGGIPSNGSIVAKR